MTEHLPGRYAMHDLLRTFAAEQARCLDGEAGRRAARQRALDHYLHTAYAAAVAMYPARDRIALAPPGDGVTAEPITDREHARRWLTAEHQVLVGAVNHAADNGLRTHAWQLAWTITDFLDWRGHWHQALAVHGVALDAATCADDRNGQVQARRGLARACLRLGRDDEAEIHLVRAIELCRESGDAIVEAGCHISLALALERRGRHRSALAHSHRAFRLFRSAGHEPGRASSLGIIGWYHALLGAPGQALAYCQRALELQRRLGEELPSTLDSLGFALHQLGRHGEAAATYHRAIEAYRQAGDRFHEADTLVHLGDSHQAAGAIEHALTAWRLALGILDDLGHPAADQVRSRCQPASDARLDSRPEHRRDLQRTPVR